MQLKNFVKIQVQRHLALFNTKDAHLVVEQGQGGDEEERMLAFAKKQTVGEKVAGESLVQLFPFLEFLMLEWFKSGQRPRPRVAPRPGFSARARNMTSANATASSGPEDGGEKKPKKKAKTNPRV